MDAKLAGGHWQCDWDDGTCSEMEAEIEFAEKDPAEKSNQFKYIFDVSLSSHEDKRDRADDRLMEMLGVRGSLG